MKNRNLWKLATGLSLIGIPFAGGCLQDNTNQAGSGRNGAMTAAAEPVVYQTAGAADVNGGVVGEAEATPAQPPALTNLANAQVVPLSTNQPVPPKVNLSPGAVELVKLAGSGVDQGVMLAYVTNSQSTFNLTAEEIIYLNDVGVPGTVVTAMIQRDQVLKEQGKNLLLSSAPAVTTLPAPAPAPVTAEPAPEPAPPPSEYPTEPPPSPPVEEVSYPVFYDSLAPYGTWVSVSGYGRCWRPTVVAVNPTWQPYFDCGHWVYTDCGWYWMSDYSWGWAPFHYGRWFRHSHWGWCWAPGTVWGPSWVSWRYSDAYCGWAPLPPGAYFSFSIGLTFGGHPVHHWDECGLGARDYHFVGWRHFDEHHLHTYAASPREVNNIYQKTVVVNNITVNNNTVINQGIPKERVASETHRTIRPVAIHADSSSSGLPTAGRSERLRGDTLTVYRPAMPQRERGETAGAANAPARPGRGGARVNAGGSAASAPSAQIAETAPSTTARPGFAPGNESRSGLPAGRETTAPPNANAPTPGARQAAQPDRSQPPAVINTPPPAPQPAARPSAAPGRNQSAAPGVAARQSAPTPSRQVASPPNATTSSGNSASTGQPNVPARAPTSRPGNTRSSLGPNRFNPSTQSAARTVTAPSAPAWRNADPGTRFERIQPSTRTAPTPTYTAPSRQTAPSYSAPAYSAPQRSLDVPRYTPAPSYSRPESGSSRSYTPAPSYSRPESSPSRSYAPAPSYSRSDSDSSRSYTPSAPAQSAPRSAPSESRSAPSRSDNNGGGRRQ